MKEFIKKAVWALVEFVFEVSVSLLVTVPASDELIEAAYKERGYRAVGGEWLLIIFIAVSVFFLTRHVLQWVLRGDEDDGRNESAGGKISGRENTANTVRGRSGKSNAEAGKNYQPRG